MSPIYVGLETDPLWTFQWGDGPVQFYAPEPLVAGSGADYPLVVRNPVHPEYGVFVEVRLWQATVHESSNTVDASNGGLFYYNSNGDVLNPYGDASVSTPFFGSGTGSGLSWIGLIQPQRLLRGLLIMKLDSPTVTVILIVNGLILLSILINLKIVRILLAVLNLA